MFNTYSQSGPQVPYTKATTTVLPPPPGFSISVGARGPTSSVGAHLIQNKQQVTQQQLAQLNQLRELHLLYQSQQNSTQQLVDTDSFYNFSLDEGANLSSALASAMASSPTLTATQHTVPSPSLASQGLQKHIETQEHQAHMQKLNDSQERLSSSQIQVGVGQGGDDNEDNHQLPKSRGGRYSKEEEQIRLVNFTLKVDFPQNLLAEDVCAYNV